MKNLNRIGLMLLGLLVGGCAMRQKVMDVPAVSMTKYNLPPGSKLQDGGPVTGKFCPDSTNDKGAIGYFDEAVKNAQTESHADFIANVSFFREGNCVTLEGTAQTIVADAVPESLKPSPATVKKH